MTRKRRIVSLVPSLTHTICEFGCLDEIVGCTSFCIDPPQLIKKCQNIGGTKTPDIEAIRSLMPTHIFTNDEENTPSHIALCEEIAPTFRCLPKAPADVPKLLEEMWRFLELPGRSQDEIHAQCGALALEQALVELKSRPTSSRKFLYLIWRNPWMAAGPDTYISRSLELIGWKNNLNVSQGRYPVIELQESSNNTPDIVLMSSEPYPFRMRDQMALKGEWPQCPEIIKVDGQLFSWFGSKSLELVTALGCGIDTVTITPHA